MTNPVIDIVAEIAQGYEGNVEQAILLLKAASNAGANAAKYQVIYADEICTPDYKHYDLFRSLEMPDKAWERICQLAQDLGIRIILDVFGDRSLNLAERLGIDEIMVHATDLTNIPLIEKVAKGTCVKVILGVGGALMSEIVKTVSILCSKQIIIMVGFQGYPTPDDENQISRISKIQHELSAMSNVTLGFADHSLPDSPWLLPFSSMALGVGARVFEKHITLGEVMKLEDYESAINPDKFSNYAKGLRSCATAMGLYTESDDFGMYESEVKYRNMVRRSVVAVRDLEKGSAISVNDVTLKRSSMVGDFFSVDNVTGSIISIDIQTNQPLRKNDVKY